MTLPSPLQRARLAAHLGVVSFAAVLVASPFVSAFGVHRSIEAAGPLLDPSAAVRLPADAEEKLSSTDAAARAEGAHELIRAIEAEWPDDHRRTFLVAVAPEALRSAVEHCVPPSVTVGQAIQESGWGRSGLAEDYKNLFGLKAGAADGVKLPTIEVVNGQPTRVHGRFRRFEDFEASVRHHDRLLSSDPRYADARVHWGNWPRFLAVVAPVYASDPDYVRRVSGLVKSYRLDEWDALVTRVARRRAACPEL